MMRRAHEWLRRNEMWMDLTRTVAAVVAVVTLIVR